MTIEILHKFNENEFQDMKRLMSVLSNHTELTLDMLTTAMQSSKVYVIRDQERIIGTASLCPFSSPTGKKANIEDVVILPKYQGKGLGRRLMEKIIEDAGKLQPITLYLTSRPSRTAANILYQKLGFEQKETNVYFMKLSPKI